MILSVRQVAVLGHGVIITHALVGEILLFL